MLPPACFEAISASPMARCSEQASHDPAIHGQGRSIHVARALRRQKGDNRSKLLWRADSSRRNLPLPPGVPLFRRDTGPLRDRFGQFVEPVRSRVARAYVVYGDSVSAILIGERAGQPGNRRSDGVRQQQAIHGLLHGIRRDGDEASPFIRGRVSRAKKTALISSRSTAERQSSGCVSAKSLDGGPPELVTQTSILPKRFSTASTNRPTAAASRTSSAS